MKEIKLTQGKVAVVDDALFDQLNKHKWYAHRPSKARGFYAERSLRDHGVGWRKKTTDYLHWHVIGKPKKGLVVDHINGDTLDNRRENLRFITQRQNTQNRKEHRDGHLVGATLHKPSGKWISKIQIKGIIKHLGLFKTREEAHNRYLQEFLNVA